MLVGKNLEILYGCGHKFINITDLVIRISKRPKKFYFPPDDNKRAKLFGDPLFGIVKDVIIKTDSQKLILESNKSLVLDFRNFDYSTYPHSQIEIILNDNNLKPDQKLKKIHTYLQFNYGSLNEEFPEQMMAISNLVKKDRVLEIGGNIGRNSIIISYILENDKNLVVLESDKDIAKKLGENRDINFRNFWIESKALSKRPLIQKNWITIPSEIVLDGYKKVETISFNEIKSQYDINFNVLVCDCEGALYYILQDDPDILKDIEKIIIENDFENIEHKQIVDELFLKFGFKNTFTQSLDSEYFRNRFPCYNSFFQVWKKE
jgi:FkbM family methyltransferase